MLEKEFGFQDLIAFSNKGVYDIAPFIKDGHFTHKDNDLKITAQGYNFFSEYLNKNTKKIPNIFLFLCGLLANLAYISKIKKDNKTLCNIIKKYHKEIIKELENLSADILKPFSNFDIDFNSEIEIFDFISSRPFRHINRNGLWGLGYVMLYLGLSCPIAFAQWFTDTKRRDLQNIYLYFLLDSSFTDTFTSKEFLNSASHILRIITLLKYYPVLRNNIVFEKKFDIASLNGKLKSNNSIENLIIYILFFQKNFWAKTNHTLSEDKQFSQALKVFSSSSFKESLNQKTFKDLYHRLYPLSQWTFLINELDDDEIKKELMELQTKNILEHTQNISGMPTELDMANIIELEKIAQSVPDINILEPVEQTFNRISRKAFLPYTYFRDYNLWISSCVQCLLLLIPLYNIPKDNKEFGKFPWKIQYLTIKGKYKYYSEELEKLEHKILQSLP